MMTLANYGLKGGRHKDPNSAKAISKSIQVRNKAETLLKQTLKVYHRIPEDKESEIIELLQDYYGKIPYESVVWNKVQSKQCIVDSILLLDTRFNPYKARRAFKKIRQMLNNLHHLPWHKEFRRIYTYSGEFRMIVSDPLIGVEDILSAAGYTNDDPEQPMHLVLGDNRMPQLDSGESVTSIIFDCMMAEVIFDEIIRIFEDCLKFLKHPIPMIYDDVINHNSWIQDYFHTRYRSTMDKARSDIQSQLINLTSFFSKLDASFMKAGPKVQRNLYSQNLQTMNDRLATTAGKSLDTLNSSTGRQSKSSETAQQQARRFLAQDAFLDSNLLKLSDDVLTAPESNNSGFTRFSPSSSSSHQQQRSMINSSNLARTNGSFNTANQNKQFQYNQNRTVLSDRYPSIDIVDHKPNTASASLIRGYPIGVDVPQNDREPLLITRNEQNQILARKTRGYHNYQTDPAYAACGSSSDHSNSNCHTQRHYSIEAYPNEIKTSQKLLNNQRQQQQAPNQLPEHPTPSRYENSSHKKYEMREPSRVFNKMHWFCRSCTYRNQNDSEICEMCNSGRI